MIPATFLTVLSLPGIILSDSYQEIAYQPNSPLYNFIFSEKFPPTVGKSLPYMNFISLHKITNSNQLVYPFFFISTINIFQVQQGPSIKQYLQDLFRRRFRFQNQTLLSLMLMERTKSRKLGFIK